LIVTLAHRADIRPSPPAEPPLLHLSAWVTKITILRSSAVHYFNETLYMPSTGRKRKLDPKSKSGIVRKFMAKGITSPTEISRLAKEINYDISPGYVSLLKSMFKAKQKAIKERLRKEKRIARREALKAQQAKKKRKSRPK
jgi:ribosomal protein S6